MRKQRFFCAPLMGLVLTATFLLLSPAAFAHSLAPENGGFSQTCSNINLQGSTLTADCLTGTANETTQTTLNLDLYIGNIAGTLAPGQGRNFSQTCNYIRLIQKTTLVAWCLTPTGQSRSVGLNLDSFVSNQQGTLTWDRS